MTPSAPKGAFIWKWASEHSPTSANHVQTMTTD
jgi:hypothetical protein